MAYTASSRVGAQAIDVTSTELKHPLGTVVSGNDPTYGDGDFIYLLGVASTVVGDVVIYSATTYQTVRTVGATHKNSGAPVAVAMSANVAAQYGWYQINGNAVVKKTAVFVAPGVPVMLSATAGRVKVLTSAGFMIVGARPANLVTTTSTTSTVVVTLRAPHIQGQIT